MAKGYSARGGFGGSQGQMMRQQQMQQKIMQMQQQMAKAQEDVENTDFTASAGRGQRQEGAEGPDHSAGRRGSPGCGDAAGSGDLRRQRGAAPGGRGHEQLHEQLHRRTEHPRIDVMRGEKRLPRPLR